MFLHIAGMGFGLMYLPSIVIVGYYFDKKRAFATGVATCGSGRLPINIVKEFPALKKYFERPQIPKEIHKVTFPFRSQNTNMLRSIAIFHNQQKIAVDFNNILRPKRESYLVSLFWYLCPFLVYTNGQILVTCFQ